MIRKTKLLFLAALAASALLHVLLLLTMHFPWKQGASPRPILEPILISLVQPPQTGAQPEAKNRPVLQQTPVQMASQPQAEPVDSDVPVVESPPQDLPPVVDASPTVSETASIHEEPAAGETETTIGSGESMEIASSPAPQAAPSAAETARYQELLEALRARIIDNIRYPPQARSRGWKGTVLLLASLDAQGRLQELTVQKSSGHSVLDQAAAALVRRVTPIGNPLGRPLAIEIPIVYELKD
jgi:protein TonB